jgi:hypothetical protein
MSRIAPGGSGDAVRARVPDVLRSYEETRATVLDDGIVDPALKELCATYLAEDDEEVMRFESQPDRFEPRELAALRWAHATAWDSDKADAALWRELHAHFSEPELVELGYFIAFTLGQMHWLRSIGLSARA